VARLPKPTSILAAIDSRKTSELPPDEDDRPLDLSDGTDEHPWEQE
jgi:hypothetical protein